MTNKHVEKIIKNQLGVVLPNYLYQENCSLINQSIDRKTKFFYDVKTIGGDIYMIISINIRIDRFEDRWVMYENELGLRDGLFQDSFYNAFFDIDTSKFPTLELWGLKIIQDEDWLRENIDILIIENYLPFADKLKDIKYCDFLINKDIEITDEVCKISPIDGLPFRKIFIAEEAGNPQLPEIKKAMRKYVNWRYEVGMEKNYEKLVKIKPVFEKLFGTSDEV